MPIPPAPGSAGPGELYVDLQSRALWLGVEASEDPAQAVLISDIEGIQPAINAAMVMANGYTDSLIATRAPLAHTHTASQVTDFAPAVEAVVNGIPGFNWVPRMIMMWSGSLAEIGVGGLAGWALCDGSNGTPNLRDKFIIGAGNKPSGAQNSGANLSLSGGIHTHTINPTMLTLEQTPAHNHGGVTGAESVPHTHAFSAATSEAGEHSHTVYRAGSSGGSNAARDGGNSSSGPQTSADGKHTHTVAGNTGPASAGHTHAIPTAGGGQGHTHTMAGGGGTHTHDITPAQIRETIPYYALAFIMKL